MTTILETVVVMSGKKVLYVTDYDKYAWWFSFIVCYPI